MPLTDEQQALLDALTLSLTAKEPRPDSPLVRAVVDLSGEVRELQKKVNAIGPVRVVHENPVVALVQEHWTKAIISLGSGAATWAAMHIHFT